MSVRILVSTKSSPNLPGNALWLRFNAICRSSRKGASRRSALWLMLILGALTSCRGIDDYRVMRQDDVRLAGRSFQYSYWVRKLRATHDEPLRMDVLIKFDDMPCLYIESIRFSMGNTTLIESDYLKWTGFLPPSAFVRDSESEVIWTSIERLDGAALRAIFDDYEKGCRTLSCFDELPRRHWGRLDLELISREVISCAAQ